MHQLNYYHRTDSITALNNTLRQVTQDRSLAELIQFKLHDVFGLDGLHLLRDTNGDKAVTLDDIFDLNVIFY